MYMAAVTGMASDTRPAHRIGSAGRAAMFSHASRRALAEPSEFCSRTTQWAGATPEPPAGERSVEPASAPALPPGIGEVKV